MKQVFLIVGYGIPKDIMKDVNYDFYLKIAFNKIWDIVIAEKIEAPLIVFSGGKTDMYKPYKRTEAGEMMKLFKTLCARDSVKSETKKWKLIAETASLSSLENALFTKNLLLKKDVTDMRVTTLCEYTRVARVQKITLRVFGKGSHVIGIDFDQSPNRYLDPAVLKQKEDLTIKYDLLALKDAETLRKHHAIHVERIVYLRKLGTKAHAAAVKQWWTERMKEAYKGAH